MEFDNVQDSGIREEFNTGSKRDTQRGKGSPSLIPIEPLKRLAKHYQNGAVKYGRHNWAKGQPLSRYYDSAMRHMWAYMEGDYNEDHLAAAAWNIFSLIATQERILAGKLPQELDDIGAIEAYNDHMLEEGSEQFIITDDIKVDAIKASQIDMQSVRSPDNIRAQNIHTDHIKAEDIANINSGNHTLTADTIKSITGKALYNMGVQSLYLKPKAQSITAGELLIDIKVNTQQATQALQELADVLDTVNNSLGVVEEKVPTNYIHTVQNNLYKIPGVDELMTVQQIIDYYEKQIKKANRYMPFYDNTKYTYYPIVASGTPLQTQRFVNSEGIHTIDLTNSNDDNNYTNNEIKYWKDEE